MLVLGFGTYDKEKHPRIAVLLDGLAATGIEVQELNRPLRFSTAQRVETLRRPWLAYRPLVLMARGWLGLTGARRHYRGDRRPDAVLVGYLGHFDVLLARLLFPRTRIALDQMVFAADTARDRGVRSRPALWLLDRLDGLACRAADVVIVDTAEHAELIPPRLRHRAVVTPVGAPEAWFDAGARSDPEPHAAAEPDLAAEPTAAEPLRAIFFGLFTPLQGTTTVGRALGLLAGRGDVEVTMVGHGQELDEARRLAAANRHVTWLDWVEPDLLPDLVAGHDVCLGIFGTSPKARRVVPNKVYQGAAAGCAVITSDTPPQRRALGDTALYVAPGDPEALARTLAELAADRDGTARRGRETAALAAGRFRAGAVVDALVGALPGPHRDKPLD